LKLFILGALIPAAIVFIFGAAAGWNLRGRYEKQLRKEEEEQKEQEPISSIDFSYDNKGNIRRLERELREDTRKRIRR